MKSARAFSAHRTAPVLFGKLATLAASVAMVVLTVVLIGWMITRVAEHPGVPREVGELPPWFAAEVGSLRKTPGPVLPAAADQPAAGAERAGAPQREAAVAAVIASVKTTAPASAAHAPSSKAAADDGFVEVAGAMIEIALMEYEMKPNKIRVKPGAVTFVLRNEGRFAHDFHVEGPGVEAHAAKFSPGRTVRLEVSLQEGEYKISCPLSNHDQRGMHGTLIVTSKLAGK